MPQEKNLCARKHIPLFKILQKMWQRKLHFAPNLISLTLSLTYWRSQNIILCWYNLGQLTYLLTKDNATEYIEYFKQETILSAKNTYAVGVNALHVQPSLEKVVIMKQTPRYDPAESDPLLLKPALSQLFNNTLTEQWIDCPFKDRIMIGAQHQVYWRYKGIPV